jgi:hypothetical protein
MKRAILLIAIWATAGFLVSAGWDIYFTIADKAKPVSSIVHALAELSVPVVGVVITLFPDLPLGLSSVIAANVATYASVGLIIEAIRRHSL